MISLLFSLVFSKITEVDDQSYLTFLGKSEYSIVLLFSPNFRDGRNAPKILNIASNKVREGISFFSCDVRNNPVLKKRFKVIDHSLFLLYHRKTFLLQYVGNYTSDGLTEFATNVLEEQDVYYPKTIADVINFQSKAPANIVIADDKLGNLADGIAHNCTQLIHVAVVTDKKLIEKLNLPPLLFNKPREYLTERMDNEINVTKLVEMAQPTWEFVINQNFIGKMTLAVLYDKTVPYHIYKINQVFNLTKQELGDSFRYVAIDYFDAPKYIKQFGVFKFSHPIFFVIGNSISMWQICNDPLMNAEETFYWARQVITGRSAPSKSSLVPTLYAQDFMRLVLPATVDAILFVAAPSMEHYKECKENAEIVAKIFQECPSIKIYEFNPLTEHVQGLQLPKSNYPQFSIWPATDPPDGKSFRADYPMSEMLKNIFRFLKSPMDDEIAKRTVARAKELVPDM
jgi:hypothetical protein